MRLATLLDGSRDGALIVVDGAAARYVTATSVARSLQAALDQWDAAGPRLAELSAELGANPHAGESLDPTRLGPPLPRAYEWIDGSSFLNHVELVRRARGAELPPELYTDPLVYQGGSGVFLGPSEPLVLPDPDWGLDFEAEVAVILGDVPRGVLPADAESCIRLLLLANDVTYRNLVPSELNKGFGFFQSKPATAFSPLAVTPDELGSSFRGGRVYHRLRSTYNGALIGDPDAGPEMHFSFCDLIAHIAKTRSYTAGTILGSGTVSNRDAARGVSCLAERRVREVLELGAAKTPFMKVGDRIRIEMLDDQGRSLFGAIDQRVEAPSAAAI
jgi:fumarylacetoacetate (FAA) hydrolase